MIGRGYERLLSYGLRAGGVKEGASKDGEDGAGAPAAGIEAFLTHIVSATVKRDAYLPALRDLHTGIASSHSSTWRLRLMEMHERDILLQEAHCFRNMHLKVYCFVRWVEKQQEVRRARSLEYTALYHWVLSLQAWAWTAWIVYIKAVRTMQIAIYQNSNAKCKNDVSNVHFIIMF